MNDLGFTTGGGRRLSVNINGIQVVGGGSFSGEVSGTTGTAISGGTANASIDIALPNTNYLAWYDAGATGGTAAFVRASAGQLILGGNSITTGHASATPVDLQSNTLAAGNSTFAGNIIASADRGNVDMMVLTNTASTAGQNFGLKVVVGSNTSDYIARLSDKNAVARFVVDGTGATTITTAGTDSAFSGLNVTAPHGGSTRPWITLQNSTAGSTNSGVIAWLDGDGALGPYIGVNRTVGSEVLELAAATGIVNLTLSGVSGSELATFANDVTLGSGIDTVVKLSLLSTDASYTQIVFGSNSDASNAFILNQDSSNNLRIATDAVGHALKLEGDEQVLNLTLSGASGSELAAFAGQATFIDGTRGAAGAITMGTGGDMDIYFNSVNGVIETEGSFFIATNGQVTALQLDASQNAIFAGRVGATGYSDSVTDANYLDIEGGVSTSGQCGLQTAGTDTNVGMFLKTKGSGEFRVFTGVSALQLTINSSTATFAGDVSLPATKKLFFDGGADTYIHENGANVVQMIAGARNQVQYSYSSVVINEDSNDVDFRVESNASTHMLFVDGGSDQVEMRTPNAGTVLAISSTEAGASSGPDIELFRNSASTATNDVLGGLNVYGKNSVFSKKLYFRMDTYIEDATNGVEDAVTTLRTITAGIERSRLRFTGTDTVINEEGVDIDFRIETNTVTNAMHVDAGNDRIDFNVPIAMNGSHIYFSSNGDNNHAFNYNVATYNGMTNGIQLRAYDHFAIYSTRGVADLVLFDHDGQMMLNDIVLNVNMTQGLTIQQNGNDNEILALKSSDVAHGMTSLAEADTFFSIRKLSAANGGAQIRALNDAAGTSAFQVAAFYGGTPDTTDTSSSYGIISFSGSKASGTGNTSAAATENVMSIDDGSSTRWLIKGNGDVHQTTDAHTALDTFDDLALLHAYDAVRAPDQIIRDDYHDFVTYNEQSLIDAGVFGSDGRYGLTNTSQMTRLMVGAHRQTGPYPA